VSVTSRRTRRPERGAERLRAPIQLLKTESKGKGNKRIRIEIVDG